MAMNVRQYQKRANQQPVIAVQLNLDLDGGGIAYRAWGGEQFGKKGDWLVDNGGEVYTVGADSFASTYKQVGPGQYIKVAKVWAREAEGGGFIPTKEGTSEYLAGDMLVWNDAELTDGYAMSRENFDSMYEMVE